MDDVCRRYVPTIRQVPKELRSLWTRCLVRTVADTVFHNSEDKWLELLMLSKCVLCNPPRSGKSHKSQRVAFTRRRLESWLAGDRVALWDSLPQYTPPRPKRASPQGDQNRRAARCIELCGEGGYSAACKALTKEPPLGHSNAVFSQLRDKHPANNPPNFSDLMGARGPAPSIEGDTVEKAIRSFHRLSGAGPSGLKPLHLQHSLEGELRDEALQHITSLVQLLASGQAPRSLAPYLAGAGLAALPKKDGSIRPVAVGDTWRRLVAKCLCKDSQRDASTYLFPFQIGVAQPLGTEVGVHTARKWAARNAADPDKVFLKVDFENAFNCVDRQTFLQECRQHFPGLSPWAEWCYMEPSLLFFGNQSFESQSGVQQGDPLGPLLFSLALQPVLARLKESHSGLDLAFAYLDDCVLAGTATAVATAFRELRDAANTIGLKIAFGRDKSLLIPSAKQNSTLDRSLFPSELEVTLDGNFDFLGSPIGDPAFCHAHTTTRVAKACKLLAALGELPDPAVALVLLRQCASFGKLVYSARVVPHTFHATALRGFDDAVRDCVESFLNAGLSDTDWSLASLSTKSSGLGLRATSKHCSAAFLASSYNCQELCRKLDASYSLGLDSPHSDASLAMADYNSAVLPEDRLDHTSDGLRQQSLSRSLDNATLQELRAVAAHQDPARAAHLELTGAPRAGTWLHASPSTDTGTRMDPLLFRTAILSWLRVPLSEADSICPLCDGIMDKYGDHALVCPCGGDRTKRHNLVRNCVYHFAASAGLHPELEKPGLLQPRPFVGPTPENGIMQDNPGARRPADVYLPRWRRGTPIALDFAITSGLRDIPASIQDAASCLTAYEDFKKNHLDTARICSAEGISFAPVIIEALGGACGPTATKIFAELAKAKAVIAGEPPDRVLTQLHQNLGIILHRENARARLKRLATPTSGTGAVLAAATVLQSAAAAA